jgi:hypothetical protein
VVELHHGLEQEGLSLRELHRTPNCDRRAKHPSGNQWDRQFSGFFTIAPGHYHSRHTTSKETDFPMHVSTVAPGQTTALTATAPPTAPAGRAATAADRNPWGFPRLDSHVAQQALDGYLAAERIVNHLIDRSIAVRVQLDHDLKAGVFTPDTVRAVELLTRARDYAYDTIEERHLTQDVQVALHDWIRANPKDDRIGVVFDDSYEIEHAVQDLLDDDEGNVRDEIAAMREHPSRRTFQSVRDSLDGSISALYESRDISGSTHVLRAAGNLR